MGLEIGASTVGFLFGASVFLFTLYPVARVWNFLFRRLAINPWTPVVLAGVFLILGDLFLPLNPDTRLDWTTRAAYLVPLLFAISRWRRYRELKGPPEEHQL